MDERRPPKKREKLVDELLGRKEFAEMWVMKWAELLQIRSSQPGQLQGDAALLQLAAGEDRRQRADGRDGAGTARRHGGTFKNPATNYYQNETDILKVSENVAQVFMGMRIQCAQCHNHPFDRWTMNDYYSFAAFFSQIGRKGTEDPREIVVFNRGGGEVTHPVTQAGDEAEVPRRRRARRPRARTAARCWPSGSPRRRTRTSRRTWPTSSGRHFFGKGIIDEVDDVRVSNPPSNPRTARRARQAVHRVQVRLQEAGPRHLHVADLSALDAAERHQRKRHAQLRPRRPAADQGRDDARRASAR